MTELSSIEWLFLLDCIAMLFTFGFPLSEWLEYRALCKKYGKEMADEIMKRY